MKTLNDYTVKQLKQAISKHNIKGYSKMKKPEVIKLMKSKEHYSKFKYLHDEKMLPSIKITEAPKKIKKKEKKSEPVPKLEKKQFKIKLPKEDNKKLLELEKQMKKLIERMKTEEYFKKYRGNPPNFKDGGELVDKYLKEYDKTGKARKDSLIVDYNKVLNKNLTRSKKEPKGKEPAKSKLSFGNLTEKELFENVRKLDFQVNKDPESINYQSTTYSGEEFELREQLRSYNEDMELKDFNKLFKEVFKEYKKYKRNKQTEIKSKGLKVKSEFRIRMEKEQAEREKKEKENFKETQEYFKKYYPKISNKDLARLALQKKFSGYAVNNIGKLARAELIPLRKELKKRNLVPYLEEKAQTMYYGRDKEYLRPLAKTAQVSLNLDAKDFNDRRAYIPNIPFKDYPKVEGIPPFKLPEKPKGKQPAKKQDKKYKI